MTASTSGAIGALPTLPIFFKLNGRTAVLAGGSQPAVWKAELLAAAGATVMVFDEAPCAEMIALATRLAQNLVLATRRWTKADLAGAAIAIGALQDEEAETFRHAAREAGVPVNIVDVPHLCDFQFGTLIERAPLLIAISTDGATPVLGQTLRARIEALLPAEIQAWAEAAKAWRATLQPLSLGFSERRRFWEAFADRALAGDAALPTDAVRQACLDEALGQGPTRPGSLDLVGLGPGDPDLVTLQAVRALQSADVIIYPEDAEPRLKALGRREATRHSEFSTVQATAAMIKDLTDRNQHVVWAGFGDPACCAEWLDRRSACRTTPRRVMSGVRCRTCSRIGAGQAS